MPQLTTQGLLNLIDEKLVIVDADQRILFVNKAASELLDDPLGNSVGQLFPFSLDEHDSDSVVPYTWRGNEIYLQLKQSDIDWHDQPAQLIKLQDVTEKERLQRNLDHHKRLFQTMMQNAPDLLAVFDAHGILIYINPAMERTLGYRVEDCTQQPLETFFDHPEATPFSRIAAKLPRETGQTINGTGQVVHQNGSLHTLSATITCVREEDGELYYIANCHDITKTIQQERRLRETQDRFRKLFQVMPHPIIFIRLSDWEILEANDNYLSNIKTKVRLLPGTKLTDHRKLIPEFDDMLGNFLKHGSVDGYPITIQDDEEAYSFLIYAQPIEYKDEAAALVSFVDFTRQKQAEQELSRLYDATSYLFLANSMRELAERIVNGIVKEFNQVDCGLILLDENRGQLVRIARAGEYGIELDEAISIDGAGLVPLVFREQQHLYAPDVREDESYVPNVPTTRSEFVIPLKSHRGIIGVLDFQSQAVDGFSESDRRLLLVFSERAAAALENMKLYEAVQQQAETLEQRVEERTQELSEAVEKQRELLRVKTRFVSMVSHEYRTPLTIISSSASILQRYGDRLEAEKKEHHLGKIQSQVHKLADMVHTVVQLNRAETIGMDFAPQEVDAAELLAQVLQQFQKKQNAIPLHLEIEGEPRPVWLDEYLFRLLTEHLIDNAVKYSRDAYPVICRLEYHDDKLLFQVKDRGIGIPAEDSDKIFTNFHRAQNVGQIPGTGLGLPLVRQAVETHNGNLYFETEEGQGTTFTVTLSIDPH